MVEDIATGIVNRKEITGPQNNRAKVLLLNKSEARGSQIAVNIRKAENGKRGFTERELVS